MGNCYLAQQITAWTTTAKEDAMLDQRASWSTGAIGCSGSPASLSSSSERWVCTLSSSHAKKISAQLVRKRGESTRCLWPAYCVAATCTLLPRGPLWRNTAPFLVLPWERRVSLYRVTVSRFFRFRGFLRIAEFVPVIGTSPGVRRLGRLRSTLSLWNVFIHIFASCRRACRKCS